MAEALFPARIDWRDGRPRSRDYGDIYHAADGMQESLQVFVGLNRLETRFRAQKEFTDFRIGELGFGTGLNFMCSVQRFLALAPESARLHFMSVEKHPLTWDDLRRAARQHPLLEAQYDELIATYPMLVPGWHRLQLFGERVSLSVYFGEARTGLHSLVAANTVPMDCWFLDGFAPDKNPEMWQESLLETLTRLCDGNTTLATFSAAGRLRRSLEHLGFRVERVSGAPRKRHVLAAQWRGRPTARPARQAITVIGAGIAGASIARALAARGHHIHVIAPAFAAASPDSGSALGIASANPAAALQPRLTPADRPLAHLRAKGFDYAASYYRSLQVHAASPFWHPVGMMQLPGPNSPLARLERVAEVFTHCHWLLPAEGTTLSTLLGREVTSMGLWFPRSGWVDLARTCHHLLAHARITLIADRVTEVLRDAGWASNTLSGKRIESDQLVIAAGPDTSRFAPTSRLPLDTVAGQLSIARSRNHGVRCVVSGDGYIVPLSSDLLAAGATYVSAPHEHLPDRTGRDANRRRLRSMLGEIGKVDRVGDFTALRTTSPDRRSMVGSMQDGLYVSAAHGSHGAVFAPLAAEIIASSIDREPPVLDVAELELLHPMRF